MNDIPIVKALCRSFNTLMPRLNYESVRSYSIFYVKNYNMVSSTDTNRKGSFGKSFKILTSRLIRSLFEDQVRAELKLSLIIQQQLSFITPTKRYLHIPKNTQAPNQSLTC